MYAGGYNTAATSLLTTVIIIIIIRELFYLHLDAANPLNSK